MNKITNQEFAAMGWHEQREYFRKERGRWVRDTERFREGGGTGVVKGPSYEHARLWWEGGAEFSHVDAPGLAEELRDLTRDAKIMGLVAAVVPVVDSVVGRTFTPEMPDAALEDEQVFGEWMDKHIKETR